MLMRTSRWISTAALLLAMLAAAATAGDLPRKAPDFAIGMAGGKILTLSQYKGKAVIVAFILTYCSHCQMTTGVLNKLQKEYGPRGLQVLGSAVEPDAESHLALFVKNYTPAFPVGFNTQAVAGAFFQPTGKLPNMPLLAFIDKQGIIRDQREGEDEAFFGNLEQNLRKEIEALLKPAASKSNVH
jgi:cytochrome c biogenesis protein CcmG/thiol:disulfide interchange protein DsbE